MESIATTVRYLCVSPRRLAPRGITAGVVRRVLSTVLSRLMLAGDMLLSASGSFSLTESDVRIKENDRNTGNARRHAARRPSELVKFFGSRTSQK